MQKKNIIIIGLAIFLAGSLFFNASGIYRDAQKKTESVNYVYTEFEDLNDSLKKYGDSKGEQEYVNSVVSLDKIITVIELNMDESHYCKKELDRLRLLSSYLHNDRDFVTNYLKNFVSITNGLSKNIDDMNSFAKIYQLRSKYDEQ